MRKTRFIENGRCYHLISRLYPPAVRLLAKRGAMRGAHQAFFSMTTRRRGRLSCCAGSRSSCARTSSISRCRSTLGATIMARCSRDVTTNATTSQRSPLVQLCGCGRRRQEGPSRVCLHVRRRRVASGPGVSREVEARGGEGRLPCWTRRCVFPLKGGSAAGHSGKSRNRACARKRKGCKEDT